MSFRLCVRTQELWPVWAVPVAGARFCHSLVLALLDGLLGFGGVLLDRRLRFACLLLDGLLDGLCGLLALGASELGASDNL